MSDRSQGSLVEGNVEEAAELVAGGTLSPLILRLDDFPITWSDDLPGELKPVFLDLARLLGVRTSRPNIPVDDASHLVQRFIEPAMNRAHPIFPRDEILESMRSAAQKERFKSYPAMWITGLSVRFFEIVNGRNGNAWLWHTALTSGRALKISV